MPGIPQVTKTGPRTYTPAAGQTVTGGHLVEPRPPVDGERRCAHAAAGSTTVLGVALSDAIAPEGMVSTPVIVNGRPVLDAAPLPRSTAVAYGGIETLVEYAAPADEGQALVAASGGRATPATAADVDPRAIVGKCTEPGGVTAAGTYALIRTS